VAKFLTKAEKLHGYVNEWQSVASRQFSVASLYDDLTNLLVSWRRLELSTWARLFDLEHEKSEGDAASWWFIAYEVTIAGPMSLIESGSDLASHSEELLTALASFFRNTSLGQYSFRLRLLEKMASHVELLALEQPLMSLVASGLQNFLQHYNCFESEVDKALQAGRQDLDKQMREVVQLASWKDTNINALRESARRSHHKLYKLVRKYRNLLQQPVLPVLEKGLQENEARQTIPSRMELRDPDFPTVEVKERCEAYLPDWQTRPVRYIKMEETVSSMRRLVEQSSSDLDLSGNVEAFSTSLIATMKDFQDQTPSTLTEKNKDFVGHLKS
jgi:midasin